MLKNLYLICGKSGSGKTTISDKLSDVYGYKVLQSYTTRKPRHIKDTDHIYTNMAIYYKHKKNNSIATYTCFDGYYYWSTLEQIANADLYVVDKEGIIRLQASELRPMVVLYIETSLDIRLKRMKLRGDSQGKIWERIKHDEKAFIEIENLADFIINGENPDVWETIVNIIEKCERAAL